MEKPAIKLITTPIVVIALDTPANPGIPIGFAYRMPESTRLFSGPGERANPTIAIASPANNARSAQRHRGVGGRPSGKRRNSKGSRTTGRKLYSSMTAQRPTQRHGRRIGLHADHRKRAGQTPEG